MGGVVQKAFSAATGKKDAGYGDVLALGKESQKQTASKAETEMAMQKQASMRARRGMGGLTARMLGGNEDKLGG